MSALDVAEVTVAGDDGALWLDAVTLHVDAGELVVLVGENGAGKSTLINVICGLVPVVSGSIAIGEIDITRSSKHIRARHGVATVVEDRAIFQALTLRENLCVAGAHRRGWAHWLEDWFPQLAPMADRRAGLLSGGEQALLALARAMVGGPRVLLLDEISTGLAPAYRAVVSDALRRTADAFGTAVLLAEQQPDANDVATRVCTITRGRLGDS